jgi:hypothetical protein
VDELQRSRPLRLAAESAGVPVETLARTFKRRVAIELAQEMAGSADARETFLFAVNQILRFCPNISVCLPSGDEQIAEDVNLLARSTVSPHAPVLRLTQDRDAAVTLRVGTTLPAPANSVTVSSSGWRARMLTSSCEAAALPLPGTLPNPIGALAAACLGAGQVFMALAGLPLAEQPIELSLFDRAAGAPGELSDGPMLPAQPLELDALLVGCGGVMNGFAYTLARLPILGHARAVDRQRLRKENIGPYVLATLEQLGLEKVQVLRHALAGRIEITPYDEDFDPLFTVRLERGHIPLPPIVIAGLDNVITRHTVQRLWPQLLIDMAAGGATAQVIVKRRAEPGMCVLEALHVPPQEVSDMERLAAESGLSEDSVLAMDTPVSKQDVLAAPAQMRDALAAAHSQGQLRCGFIRTLALDHERESEDFAAAAPFVVAYSGVLAAAELTKDLMGVNQPGSMRYQLSFASWRARAISPPARHECECMQSAHGPMPYSANVCS